MHIRELAPGDTEAFAAFLGDVPDADRTFFKEDIDDPQLAARWVADTRTQRVLAFDGDGRVIGFAALVPGHARTAHVADLRLIIASRARGQGLGTALARHMLVLAVRQGFRKVTVEVASESTGAIEMFRDLGFVPEALLCDHLLDADGALHDLMILAHPVDANHSAMLTGGFDAAEG